MYCPRPFEQYYVTSDGDVHLCCPQWIAMPVGNVLASNPVDIWSNWVSANIRASVVDGSLRHCTSCKFLPRAGGCVREEAPAELPSLRRIKTFTMAYDATCNLRCPSCRTEAKGQNSRSERIQEILVGSGLFKLVDQLCSSGSGDPLASQLYWELLDQLPASEYPDLRLTLQTNGLLLNEKTWARLVKHRHPVDEVLISIDAATPETYRLNRGGRFDVLLDNLTFLATLDIPVLQLNFVVQANNLDEMTSFVDLADKFRARRVYFSSLGNWGTYTVPEYLKRAVHLPSHPRHHDLVDILSSGPLRDRQRVILAGLPDPRRMTP